MSEEAIDNQQSTTTSKISQFWEKSKVFRGIVKTVIFPWGIASIIKKCVIRQKNLDKRMAEKINKTPFTAETTTINSEIKKIEKQYEQYAQNPQDESTKQKMIKTLKEGNPCAVYRFLVKQISSEGTLSQNFVEMLKNNGLTAYEMFINLCQIDMERTSDMVNIMNAIQSILNDPDNSESSMYQLNRWFSLSDSYNSIELLICNAFTDKELETVRTCKGVSDQFKTLANDLIALRSFFNSMSEDVESDIKFSDYEPTTVAYLLRMKKVHVSNKCLKFFEQFFNKTDDDGEEALRFLMEQKLMIMNKS